MIDLLITLIVYLIILGVIWWAVNTVLGVIPMPGQIKTVINVLLIVVLVLILVTQVLLPLVHMLPLHLH